MSNQKRRSTEADGSPRRRSGSCSNGFEASSASNLHYRWSEGFREAGKKQLAGDTIREATTDEVKSLRSEKREARSENRELEEVAAEIRLEKSDASW